MSPRTLQRQLRLEGTTFQAVLASTREDLARHYLSRGTMRTPEIAYLLGYDDTNSFYRAFRTWTGTTPEALRTPVPASVEIVASDARAWQVALEAVHGAAPTRTDRRGDHLDRTPAEAGPSADLEAQTQTVSAAPRTRTGATASAVTLGYLAAWVALDVSP